MRVIQYQASPIVPDSVEIIKLLGVEKYSEYSLTIFLTFIKKNFYGSI